MGHVAREDALAFGWTLSVASVAIMGLFVNFLAAALLAFTIFFYVVVYTLWLKRRTPQNIVIGGLAGALPPAIGWAAVTGIAVAGAAGAGGDHLHVDAAAFLGAVAVALRGLCPRRRADAAGGEGQAPYPLARSCSTRWCWCRWACCRPSSALGGVLYLAASAGIGLWFLWEAIATCARRDEVKEPAAQRLFGVSLLYMFALFAALIVEKLVGIPALFLALRS